MRRCERHQETPGTENTPVAVARCAGRDSCFGITRMEGSIMVKADRDRFTQWGNAKNKSRNDPAPKRSPTLPPRGTTEQDIVQVCGWCLMKAGRLNLLRIAPCQESEAIAIYQFGTDLRIFRLDWPVPRRLYISHGICLECRDKEFPPETTKV
jgi:hypothetical protein